MVIDTLEKLACAKEKLFASKRFGLDVEASGLRWPGSKLAGVGIFTDSRKGFYFPVQHAGSQVLPQEAVLSLVKALFEHADEVHMHNADYEGRTFLHHGLLTPADKVLDSMAAAALLWEGSMGLKPLAEEYTGRPKGWDLPDTDMTRVPAEISAPYCIRDAADSFDLNELFRPKLEREGVYKVWRELECPVTQVVAHMEYTGFKVNRPELAKIGQEVQREIQSIIDRMHEIIGYPINLNSGEQLGHALVEHRKLWKPDWVGRTKTGKWKKDRGTFLAIATNAQDRIAREAAELMIRYSKLEYLNKMFVVGLDTRLAREDDGRVRCSFNQFGTETGRWSSSDPNLQNIPRENEELPNIRRLFIAEDMWELMDTDFSQIELRLIAHFSGDARMLKVYQEGGDIHQSTADGVGCSRQAAKPINFGLHYGMGPRSLRGDLAGNGIYITDAQSRSWHKRFFQTYEGVPRWHRKVIAQARKTGRVKTIVGSYRPLTYINSDDHGQRSFAERQAINTPVQGSAAALIKIAMRNIYRELVARKELWHPGNPGGRARIVSQVHDELILETKADPSWREEVALLVQDKMENSVKLKVPLIAEPAFGENWKEAKG